MPRMAVPRDGLMLSAGLYARSNHHAQHAHRHNDQDHGSASIVISVLRIVILAGGEKVDRWAYVGRSLIK